MEAALAQTATEQETSVSPGMRQYIELKSQYPDMLLFYRMGDFYELFFDDAVTAAGVLDIALTKRGTYRGEPIPMCGVPYHSADPYLERLITSGHKVAICEQLETPQEAKQRGYKAVVRRDVVRIVTPGTLTEESLLSPDKPNYLAAVAGEGEALCLACVDISTGEFSAVETTLATLAADLARFEPSEVLLPESLAHQSELSAALGEYRQRISTVGDATASAHQARRSLLEYYGSATTQSWGSLREADVTACGMLCDYIRITQKEAMPRLDAPKRQESAHLMQLDAAAQRNLELTHTLSGQRRGSLLSVLDETCTAAGGRLMAARLSRPLAQPDVINARLDAVDWALACSERDDLRSMLKECPDPERALGRLHVGRGGPRDMVAVMMGLSIATQLAGRLRLLQSKTGEALPADLRAIIEGLGEHSLLCEELSRALAESPPMLAREGGFIAAGYHPALDEFRSLRDESRRVIAGMQAEYVRQSGITSLKIKHNNVLGYFVEITRRHEAQVPQHFIHRQTMKDALRYSTVELAETEQRIVQAADQALKLELELYDALLERITEASGAIVTAARAMAQLDVTLALAHLAVRRRYVRPVVDDSMRLEIRAGRHPVVEQFLDKQAGRFIGNDCVLEASQRLWLLTGPNMAGKSTFLRQNALIVLMAQMGSYVPAESAHIGVVDKLFSRVGAADDLARGQSTFMVEMVETAAILNQASERSLVILDEIGRGTATYDGLSIAWAVAEHLHHAIRCRGLFATHYHELTHLAETLPSLACYTMRVREWKGEVVFLHEVARGTADRSYGIHVARLAGLPAAVLERARAILRTLESQEHSPVAPLTASALPLFAGVQAGQDAQQHATTNAALHPALERLRICQPDSLTPREALDVLYELVSMAEG